MLLSLSRHSLLRFPRVPSKNALFKPLSVANRNFFGKKEVKKIDPKETDFDLIIVGKKCLFLQKFMSYQLSLYFKRIFSIGGANAAALGKFLQTDHIFHGKLAVVTSHSKYL